MRTEPLINDPKLRQEMSDALRHFRPIAVDYHKALKHHHQRLEQHDKVQLELIEMWTGGSIDWVAQLRLLQARAEASQELGKAKAEVSRLAPVYYDESSKLYELWRKVMARVALEMGRENRAEQAEARQFLEDLVGLDVGSLSA